EAHLEKTALNFSPVVNNPTELMKIIKQLFSPKPTEGETKPEDFKCEFLRKYLVIFDSIYDRNQKNLLNFKVKIPGATEPTLKDIFLEKYMPKLAIISTGVFEGSENLNQLLLDIKTLVYLFFYLGIECVLITDLGGGQSTSHPSTYSEKLENRLANKIKEQVFGSLVLPELEDLSFFKIPLQLKEIFCCSNKLLTPPCIEENQMIFGGEDTFLYSVNPLDGKSLWKVKCGDWIKYPPVIEDGMVYLGGIDKRVRAIHAFDGKQKWQFGTSGWIMGTPVVEKTKIYFASKDNSIYVIDKFKGTRIVSKDIEAKIITTLWMSGNTLIIQDGELFLQAFSATTLNKLWEKKLNSKIKKGIIYENLFIYSDEEGHLEAITTHKAHIKWRRTLGKPAVFLDVDKQRKLIVLNQRGILLYYNVTTGKSEWEYNKINPVFEAPGIDDRFIWIFSSDNHLVGLSKNTGSPNIDIPLYLKSVKCINAYQDNVIISDEQGLVIRIPIKDLNYKTYKDDWKCRKTSSVNFLFPLISQDKMGAFEVEINDDKEVIEVIDQETGEVIKKEKKTAQKTKHSLFNTETRITAPMKLIDDGTSHLLMIATQGKFLAVFTDLSQEKWSVNIENIISEPMEFYRGLIVATTIMGEYYVIDPRGGKLTWSKKICRKFNTTPRIKKRLLFVGGDDGVVFCISIASGKIEWKVIVGKDIQSAPLMLRKSLVVVNNEGRVLNLDMETGRIIWSYNTLSTVTYNPVILNDDKIIITCKESYIFCLNPMGKVVWKFVYPGDSFVGEPLVSGKIMFAGLKSGELLAIDTRRGTLARKTHLPENLSVNPILCKDHLIAGTIHGKIFAWDTEKGNTYLIKEMEDPVFHPMVYHKKYIYVIQGEDTIVRVPFKKKAPTAEAGAEQKTQETSQQPDTDTREMPLPDLNQSEPSTIPDSQERFDAQQMNVSGRLTRDGRPLEQGTYRRTSILDRVNTSQEQEDEDSALSRYSPMILLLITIIAIVAKLMENEVLFQSSIAFGGLFLIIIILDQVTMEGSRVKRYMNRLVPSGMLDRLSGNTVEKEISLIFQDSPNLNQALAPLNQKEARFVIQKINEISYDVVLKNGGYVLSNPGRGIYIAFNVGGNLYNHATLALESALTINRRISRLQNEIQQKLGRRLPAKIKVDFGIVSGKAHVGYRGSGKQMEPYVVGSMPDKATEFSDMLRDSEYNILINNETNRQLDGRFKIEDLGEKNLNSTKGTERVYGVVTR
ncbi:MAG: PQQ-binding-like beta-propeller repeat protein, partial [Vulcanimicrobiota bacterium]